MSLDHLLCPHPATQLKLKLEFREKTKTLGTNLDLNLDLDQRGGMKMGIIISNVRGISASTLYAVVILPSYTVLCSIISS